MTDLNIHDLSDGQQAVLVLGVLVLFLIVCWVLAELGR